MNNLQIYGNESHFSGSFLDDRSHGGHILTACPFCGTDDELELCNTHTPSYWVRCHNCGAEAHGRCTEEGGSRILSKEAALRLHLAAMESAVLAWNTRAAVPAYDLVAHLEKQSEFSLETFGPGPRVRMVVDHIRAELIEIEASPTDVYEWIDVAMLAFDGAWRAGHSPAAIAAALGTKLAKNITRTWPDWRTHDPDQAIKHTPDAPIEAAPTPLIYPEEMSDAIRDVLGRPNFACIQIADLLRASGVEIPSKAEAEQAAVIHFLLKFVLRHGDAWADTAARELESIATRVLSANRGEAS